jgi:hypothetical protein
MLATKGKSWLAALLFPFVPGTFLETGISVNVLPVTSVEIENTIAPTPSPLI